MKFNLHFHLLSQEGALYFIARFCFSCSHVDPVSRLLSGAHLQRSAHRFSIAAISLRTFSCFARCDSPEVCARPLSGFDAQSLTFATRAIETHHIASESAPSTRYRTRGGCVDGANGRESECIILIVEKSP